MTSFPPFLDRAPWWGADLQTLRNTLVRARPSLERFSGKRLTLPLADGSGDALAGLLQLPDGSSRRALVVLVHGLAGSEESAYMVASAAHWLERRHPVLRLNLRGAGPSRPLCRLQYHAGRTTDLREALAALDADLAGRGVLLVGYSLGANMLLKFLAEHAGDLPIRGAASVSAPIDLSAASQRFLAPRNRIYHWHLLRGMKREALTEPAAVSEVERRAILAARSIYEFDDFFVGPRNGYAGAEAYYADNMARRFLSGIRVPTLVIHARNDPWIPGAAYDSFPWHESLSLVPLRPESGGHLGFHGRDSATAWHDRCIGDFFEGLGA